MNKTVVQHSVEVLKILYMVVAGLALAVGLQRFVLSNNGQFEIEWFTLSFWFFVIFITTVARFVHGAIRHFDESYVEEPERVNWKIGQPIWDFIFLGLEALMFFLLAFSIDNHFLFIQYYLWLLAMDCVWLLVTTPPPKTRTWAERKWWIVANLIVLGPVLGFTNGSIFWSSSRAIELSPPWLLCVFIGTVAAHTIMDYPLNWKFYFGRPLRKKQKERASNTSLGKQ